MTNSNHTLTLVKITSGRPARETAIPAPRLAVLVVRESRCAVQLMYLLRFTAGVWLAGSGGFLGWQIFAGAGSWMCLCVAVYVINGVADVHGDRHNRSSRPIASGALDAQSATQAVVWLVLSGLVLAALVSAQLVIAFMLSFVIGWMYSCGTRPLKNSVPGMVLSGTAGGMLTYFAGWVSAGGGAPRVDVVVLVVGLSLWMGLVGTATKDLRDVAGDRLAGRRTLPVLLDAGRAKAVAGVVAIGYGCLLMLTARLAAPGILVPVGCVLIGAVGVAAAVACSADLRAGRNAYGAYMCTQYAATLAALVQ
jgi:4-hydroxybenzoate polyprenyltransferase